MDFSRIRIDISNPAPVVSSDHPFACPDCQGRGEVMSMSVRMLGPDEFDNTPQPKTCERCGGRGLALDLEPPPEDDPI